MKKILLIAFLFSSLTSSALAVDGYKGVKFGAGVESLKKENICNFKKWKKEQLKGMDSYYCSDFKFSGESTMAIAIFLNGKFSRFAININQSVDPVLKALAKKYGNPSSTSTQQEANDVMANGGTMYVRYDNDTIILAGTIDQVSKEQSGQLIYTSPDYDKVLLGLKVAGVEDDL